ncbi:MAG: cytochrome c family protein [Pseudomonadota bacterium]
MDSFELNKIAGALLGALLFVFGTGFLSELIFYEHHPETPGYVIEIAEAATDDAAEEPVVISVAALMANADVAGGEKAARKCSACHTFDNGGANKVGPNLWNIVNRAFGAVEGFKYSSALMEYAAEKTWTFDELNGFLQNPRQHLPGTSMGFAGLKKDDERADMLAYLRSLSDSPAPLPTE